MEEINSEKGKSGIMFKFKGGANSLKAIY